MLTTKKLNKLLSERCVPEPNTGCLLWEGALSNGWKGIGYPRITLRQKNYQLHREVLERKINRKLRDGEVARHLCGTYACLEASHLAPGSQADNVADTVAMGRIARGEILSVKRRGSLHHAAKVNEKIVVQMRELYADGFPVRSLADFFGLTTGATYAIVTRASWRHIQ